LENKIFPDLGITTMKPLVVCTAQRWLIRLGWRCSLVKKGVYKDGHDCDNVIKYWDHNFLPRMKLLEAQMVTYEGPEQVKTMPVLKEGKKQVVPCFMMSAACMQMTLFHLCGSRRIGSLSDRRIAGD
jgi:hypothetical protein